MKRWLADNTSSQTYSLSPPLLWQDMHYAATCKCERMESLTECCLYNLLQRGHCCSSSACPSSSAIGAGRTPALCLRECSRRIDRTDRAVKQCRPAGGQLQTGHQSAPFGNINCLLFALQHLQLSRSSLKSLYRRLPMVLSRPKRGVKTYLKGAKV